MIDLKMLRPYKNYVLVERIDYEEKVGSIVLPDLFDSKFYEVLKVGKCYADDEVTLIDPGFSAGDVVVIETFDGAHVDEIRFPNVKLVHHKQVMMNMGPRVEKVVKQFDEGSVSATSSN